MKLVSKMQLFDDDDDDYDDDNNNNNKNGKISDVMQLSLSYCMLVITCLPRIIF